MNGVSVFATFEKSYFQFILRFVSFPISFLQFLNFSMIQACARARVFFVLFLPYNDFYLCLHFELFYNASQLDYCFLAIYISSIVFFSSVFFLWYKKYGSCLGLSWAQLENLQCYESNYKVVRTDINRSFRSAHELVSVNSCCHACADTCKIVSKFL